MKQFKFILLLICAVVTLSACKETVDKEAYDELMNKTDSFKLVIENQNNLIDSLSSHLDVFIAEKAKQEELSSAATFNYFTLDKISKAILRVQTKKGYDENSSAMEMTEAWKEGFSNAGYSFAGTLSKYANEGFTKKELTAMVFLLIPYMQCEQQKTIEGILSEQELKDSKEIARMMKGMNN